MFQAACKIGSDFWRSDVKIHLWKVAPDSVLLVKFCRFAFLRPAFGFPRVARPAFGVARITSKSREKQLKNAKKATKTEHKNVGLYAQKTPYSAY